MWSETPPSPGPRFTWWRHQMETFSDSLAICGGNSPATGEFPAQRPVTRSFNVFFDLRLNTWLSKLLQGWWFDTPLCPLWRHSNDSACTCTYVSELWYIRMAWMMLIVTNSLRQRVPQRQWIGSALVQIMACRRNGAKPLSNPMQGYCQMDPKEQFLLKF